MRDRTALQSAVGSLILGLLGWLQPVRGVEHQISTPQTSDKPAATATKLRDLQPFFNATCVTCHMEGGQNGGLVLEEGAAYQHLVGVKSTGSALNRVEPGDPDKSYLIHKLRGTQSRVGGGGSRMPLGGSPIDQATLDRIEQWIRDGAPR